MKFFFRILLLALAPSCIQAASEPRWQDWSQQSFAQAKEQDKFVFLYLEAVWCHWCHVMQAKTFTDTKVLERLQENYVSVRVDHDAHPGLANRYRAWGWPALIFMSPDGTEIVKRAGYIGPQPFARLLDAIVADPSPETRQRPLPAPAVSALLNPELRRTLQQRHHQTYDNERGGLDLAQKFLDPDSLEYSLLKAAEGDREQRSRVLQTLDASTALIDPVWGGMYQYSTGGRWDRPHYEKIMRSQYRALRSYALAYGYFQRDEDRRSAVAIRDYLLTFLRGPEGAFYVSQDADLVKGQKAHDYFALNDDQRRARGMPAIDTHRYTQANGRAIEALAYWYEVSGDMQALNAAVQATNWMLENRRMNKVAFRHGHDGDGNQFLGDNLAMTRALLQLYRATADRKWLGLATETADYIGANFKGRVGFNTTADDDPLLRPTPTIEENISLARCMNLLFHYSGEENYRAHAEHAMRYLAARSVALSRITEAGILLADRELANDPQHLTVVGGKSDEQAARLFRVALRQAGWYRRVEWWDRAEGNLPHADVPYPDFDRPAAYVCNDGRCSTPSFTADRYQLLINQLSATGPAE